MVQFQWQKYEGIYYRVKSIIATTSRKRPSPVSDDQAWSRMIERKPLLECHKSWVFKSADQAGWQIYSSWLTKKDGWDTIRTLKGVKLMQNVMFKLQQFQALGNVKHYCDLPVVYLAKF